MYSRRIIITVILFLLVNVFVYIECNWENVVKGENAFVLLIIAVGLKLLFLIPLRPGLGRCVPGRIFSDKTEKMDS